MNIKEARKILGKEAEKYSDEKLKIMLFGLKQLAEICYERIMSSYKLTDKDASHSRRSTVE